MGFDADKIVEKEICNSTTYHMSFIIGLDIEKSKNISRNVYLSGNMERCRKDLMSNNLTELSCHITPQKT
ncbi:hypothetical protein YN1HA_8930 [Sulfurisphaera ohwakuensis]